MKRCLVCQNVFTSPKWLCPACGWSPPAADGTIQFSPDLAAQNDGFDPVHFEALYAVEAGNFWFRARNSLIIWFIRRYFPATVNFMEVGCGTGFVLAGLNKAFPAMKLTGTEVFSKGISFAAARLPASTSFYQMDGRNIPFAEEFDLIGAFDCLEHIAEDETVLTAIHKALKPGGGVVFTVPQHPFMWSAEDEAACHHRRYTRSELQRKMEKTGFEILDTTSFVSLLFPFMMADRLLRGYKKKVAAASSIPAGLRLSPIINSAFAMVSSVELFLIRLGLRFPCGGSRLVVGRKK